MKNRDIIDTSTKDEKELKEMNSSLQYELSNLRENEQKLIENNKKLHSELVELRTSKNTVLQDDQLKKLKEKLNFHQDENLRLSHELSNSQKKYNIMKNQLSNIENEKSNISKKIDELTETLESNNVVETPFKQKIFKKSQKSSKSDMDQEIDLNEEIKQIFSKKS